MKRPMHLALTLGLVLASGTAQAYDSRCYVSAGSSEECKEGPDAVRNKPWVGNRTEHTHLFQQTVDLAGLPQSIEDTFELVVYTNGSEITLDGQPVPTAKPSSFKDGVRATFLRELRVDELAQLPDFSYSLWDWAQGNETCPLDSQLSQPVDMVSCHEFAGHMGAANSNHFVPQSQVFFSHYHQLALERAAACRQMSEALGAQRERFGAHLEECEKEALALEGVAHHFLQDAWSAGHMWERWGSPDPSEYGNVHEAVMVGLTSGLIHGARGSLLFAEVGPLSEVNDPLCAPHPEVRWVSGTGHGPFAGLGDLYAGTLSTAPEVARQRTSLFDCAVSSLRAVYDAFGPNPVHGSAGVPDPNVVMSLDPSSAECFGQRVTNEALLRGAALDFTYAGLHVHFPLLAFAGSLVPIGGDIYGFGLDPEQNFAPASSTFQYNLDVLEITAKLAFYAEFFPEDTDMASGGLPTLLGMKPNSEYAAKNPLSGYVDPALPWSPDGDQKSAALSRAFRRAHAKEWCETVKSDHPDFDPKFLIDAVGAATRGSPEHDDACTTCVTFLQPQVRFGNGPADYDLGLEPLCHYLAPTTTEFRYAVPERTDLERHLAATRAACGCDPRRGTELMPEGRIFQRVPEAGSPETRRICGVGGTKRQGFYLANPETRLPIANAAAELVPMMFGGEPEPDSLTYELVAPETDGAGFIEVEAMAVGLGHSYGVTLVFPGTRNSASILVDFGEVRGPAEIFEGDGYPGGVSPSAYIPTFPLPRQLLDWNGRPYHPIIDELEGHRLPVMTFRYEWVASDEPPDDPYLLRSYDWFQGGYYQYRSEPYFDYPAPFTVELGSNFRLVYPHPQRQDLVRVEKLNNTWDTFVELRTTDVGCGPEGSRTTWHRLNP